MERRTIRLAMLFVFFFALTPAVRAEEPAAESVAVQVVHTIILNIEVKGKNCGVKYDSEVPVDTGDIVIWDIVNNCGKETNLKLDFGASGPLNRKCKVKDTIEKDQTLSLICKVTAKLNPEEPQKKFPYDIKVGGSLADPKLIVRPPGTLCDVCRKACPGNGCEGAVAR